MSENMIIRRACSKDIDKILDLLNQVKQVHVNGRPDLFKPGTPKYNEDELNEMFVNDNKPMFVICDEADKVCGYALCQFKEIRDDAVLNDMKYLYIDDLCIDEAKRGQHLGKTLYEYVLQFAKDNGCRSLLLNVWSCNTSAQHFYEAMGLKPQRTYMEQLLV